MELKKEFLKKEFKDLTKILEHAQELLEDLSNNDKISEYVELKLRAFLLLVGKASQLIVEMVYNDIC